MRHLALTVQYDGTDYRGFQSQPQGNTIQDELERALTELLQHPVKVIGAGRTDAGVHAIGQVIALRTGNPIPEENLLRALNALLGPAISAVECRQVPDQFHPCYSARGKLYSYRILNRSLPSPFIERFAWHVSEPLDVEAMRQAAVRLKGEHDFAAFASAGSSARTTVRQIWRLDVETESELIETRVAGSGFLYMMVRNIMGALVEAGRGRISADDIEKILRGLDRAGAPPPAPPQGLCLVRVEY
jgi:tRNA pseudouridine38-40 synthase